jgi:hypothetical protein
MTDPYAASNRTGLFAVPPTMPQTTTATLAAGQEFTTGILNPQNPLFWFGMILAATLGFVAISGNIRVGPVKAGAQIGKG